MHSNHRIEPKLVRFIVETAAHDSARSLELLRAIEVTVDVNETLQDTFSVIADRFSKAAESVCSRIADTTKDPIDPDGSMRTSIESTMKILEGMSDWMVKRRASADSDQNLRPDDGVVDSFDRVIASIVNAHNMLNEFNWAVMEHDADLSPRSGKGPFRSAKDLIKAIVA